MAKREEVRVPDIGDFDDVEIIEVLVEAGDEIDKEQSLITLESDKASMEVPSPRAGKVAEVKVAVGDRVSEGDPILELEVAGGDADGDDDDGDAERDGDDDSEADSAGGRAAARESDRGDDREERAGGEQETVRVPDIGDFDDVEIIEVLVEPGDEVDREQSLITLESDKASMEVPSPRAGRVAEVMVAVGDRVSEGSEILRLEPQGGDGKRGDESAPSREDERAGDRAGSASREKEDAPPAKGETRDDGAETRRDAPRSAPLPEVDETGFRKAHASPAVRRFARELGADIGRIDGSGPKGRILKEDVKSWVKKVLSGSAGARADATPTTGGGGIPPLPEVDFERFGPVGREELPRIKRLSGPHLHRAWLNLPMVTHHDEADITELEAFRKSLKKEAETDGIRLTALVFIMKAVVDALRAFPRFNASLSPDGKELILKRYFHVGIAVDTPNGLVVPVVRDVDTKSLFALSKELAELSGKARDGKLKPDEMQGGCISISSLGGIGGTAFTPIVNAPEVAILGVTRARMQPVWDGETFVPRLMLPLDLTYDHRVVDGADAARFCAHLCRVLGDLRRLLL